jgi:uncharacterized alkaline shock family protein YloU
MPYWLQDLLDSKYFIGGAWTFAALFVLWLFKAMMFRPPRVVQAFNTEGGQVLVTRRAVKELVVHCCDELGGTGSADVDITVHAGELRTRVALKLRHNANVKGVTAYLRERIVQALTENLGLDKLGDVDIVVVGVLEEPKVVKA